MVPQNKPTQVVNSNCGSEKKKGGTAANFDISKGGRKDCANFFLKLWASIFNPNVAIIL